MLISAISFTRLTFSIFVCFFFCFNKTHKTGFSPVTAFAKKPNYPHCSDENIIIKFSFAYPQLWCDVRYATHGENVLILCISQRKCK